MNRKERRKIVKKLGLIKHKNHLSFEKRMDLLKENIEAGVKLQEQVNGDLNIYNNQFNDEKQSSIIFNLAESIAKRKNIPFFDATEEAKGILEKQIKNKK